MIADTSAIVAIARQEPGFEELAVVFHRNAPTVASAASFVELSVVLRAEFAPHELDDLLATLDVTPVPVTVDQARLAAQAYRDYGKGSGSPARLNLGDTFSYALAKDTGRPLLFVGEDFTHTDVTPAR